MNFWQQFWPTFLGFFLGYLAAGVLLRVVVKWLWGKSKPDSWWCYWDEGMPPSGIHEKPKTERPKIPPPPMNPLEISELITEDVDYTLPKKN